MDSHKISRLSSASGEIKNNWYNMHAHNHNITNKTSVIRLNCTLKLNKINYMIGLSCGSRSSTTDEILLTSILYAHISSASKLVPLFQLNVVEQ